MTHSTQDQDSSFPYVLVCSTVSTVIALASVWISFAPAVGVA
jgi:type III secretory pathway component EscS